MTTGSARIIVLVILIVIAIIATYAVINFIMSLTQTSLHEYEVVPQAYISQSQAASGLRLDLYIVNRGPGRDRIILIELDCGKALYIYREPIEVKPNEAFNVTIDNWIKVREEEAIVPGDVCRLRLHSEKYSVVLLQDVVIAGS